MNIDPYHFDIYSTYKLIKNDSPKLISLHSFNLHLLNSYYESYLKALQNNTNITECIIRTTSAITPLELIELSFACKNMEYLQIWYDLLDSHITISTFIEKLSTAQNLVYLSICETKITQHLLDSLFFNKTIRKLHFRSNNFTDSDMSNIGYLLKINTVLEQFKMSCNDISIIGAKYLSNGLNTNINKYSRIKKLSFIKCFNEQEAFDYIIDVIKINKNLVTLDVAYNKFNMDITKLLKAININKTIMSLDISSNYSTIEDLIYLGRYSNFEKIYMRALRSDVTYFVESLLNQLNTTFNLNLVKLDISSNKFTLDTATKLGILLKKQTNITHLDMNNCVISSLMAKHIIKPISNIYNNTNLQHLSMSDNKSYNKSNKTKPQPLENNKYIINMIKNNKSITSLNLNCVIIPSSYKIGVELFDAFELYNGSIVKFEYSRCSGLNDEIITKCINRNCHNMICRNMRLVEL
jgi:Ran GTPase-activating protein (RanGAP) involved in mRNA processing and transport